MKGWWLIIWLTALLTVEADEQEDSPLVTIGQGKLRGRVMETRRGGRLHAFMKIPYAKPPLGKLRFAMPQKADGWTGVRDATEDGVVCPTRNIYVKDMFRFLGEEDCLYLNVYTPAMDVGTNRSSMLLPVMVYIHGGGWISGSGNSFYYPPNYLLDMDVLLVAFNYRLGPLGFLSLEDDVVPGNWGLKDQSFALRWIKDNIRHFGGNPDLVTIFGESAGGSSVHFHMLSPMSRGLFHRAISQSGTALTSWSLAHPGVSKNNSMKLAKLVECPIDEPLAMLDCMRKVPVQTIIEQDVHFMKWLKQPMITFKPVAELHATVGEGFLPEYPEDTVRCGRSADVPWITGFNSGDGALMTAGLYLNKTRVEEMDKKFNELIPMSLFIDGKTKNSSEIADRIRSFYLHDRISDWNYMELTNIFTDGWFGVGTQEAVKLHREFTSAPVYYYYFAYRGSVSFSSAFGDTTKDYQVCHADELIYLFPMKKDFPGHNYTKDDIKMMDQLSELWANFATYGTPTRHARIVNWKPVQSSRLEYLHFGKNGLRMEDTLLPDRFDFWSSLNLPTTVRENAKLGDDLPACRSSSDRHHPSLITRGAIISLILLITTITGISQ